MFRTCRQEFGRSEEVRGQAGLERGASVREDERGRGLRGPSLSSPSPPSSTPPSHEQHGWWSLRRVTEGPPWDLASRLIARKTLKNLFSSALCFVAHGLLPGLHGIAAGVGVRRGTGGRHHRQTWDSPLGEIWPSGSKY